MKASLQGVLQHVIVFSLLVRLSIGPNAIAQTVSSVIISAPEPQREQGIQQSTNALVPTEAPLTLTLQDALARAKKNNIDYTAAQTDVGLAKEDKVQSRAAALPGVNYATSYIYTEGGNPFGAAPKFIANNAVHEYTSWGNIHEDLSLANVADIRRAQALEAVARAKAEIATRGMVLAVVRSYYGFVVAQRKYATSQRAAAEGQRFYGISQKLEQGGEVAHSDVLKAQLQLQQTQRDLQEAQLEMNRSRLEFSILIFPDFTENFTVVDDLTTPEPLPPFAEVQAAAANKNPQLRAALATLQAAEHEVTATWSGFLPSLTMDYYYGIDATHYATYEADPLTGQRLRNLGYWAQASLQLPVWNWGSNRSKVKQADLRRNQAKAELTLAQRQLLADLRTFYNEAQTAREQIASLQHSAELAAESLHLTTLRYQAGESTVLEVVDAQNTLNSARNAFDDGQVRYRVGMANLQTLTGTL